MRIAPTRPPAEPTPPKGKPTPPKEKPAPPRPKGEGRPMRKKVVVFSIVLVIGIIAIGLILLLSSRRGGGMITTNPSAMMPTSADLPGWTIGEGRSTTPAILALDFGWKENELSAWGYESGYELGTDASPCSKDNTYLLFAAIKFSSVDGAHAAYLHEYSHESTAEVYSVSLGDEAIGWYFSSLPKQDVIMFRKANILGMVLLRGSTVQQQGQVLSYAQILESKIC